MSGSTDTNSEATLGSNRLLAAVVVGATLLLAGCGAGDGYPQRVAGPETCSEGKYQLYEVKVYGRKGTKDVALDCEAALRAIIEEPTDD